MITNIYSIVDTVALVADSPIIMANDETLRRACRDMLRDGKEKYCRHPADYAVFRVGKYNTQTGEVIVLDRVDLGNLDEFCAAQTSPDDPAVRG